MCGVISGVCCCWDSKSLIAADIVETVTVDLSLTSIATLGLLVLVRTFLSWSIELETAGHWPWQPRPEHSHDGKNE